MSRESIVVVVVAVDVVVVSVGDLADVLSFSCYWCSLKNKVG
jgi:hypothetical protein